MRSHKARFYLLVLFQIVLLAGLIGAKQITVMTGQPVLLKTMPVDPWDPFRGEYVALQYSFSRLDGWQLMGSRDDRGAVGRLSAGETVYVTLRPEGRFWGFESVSRTAPTDGSVFLRGTVTRYQAATRMRDATADIRYGIESYFVQHGKARDLERRQWNRDKVLVVDAVVDSHGRAVIRGVHAEPGP